MSHNNIAQKRPWAIKKKTFREEEVHEDVPQPPTPIADTKKDAPIDDDPDPEPIIKSPKEKECWALYKKMVDKGVSVSYDTILR